jgi:hypothetical protein
MFFVEVKPALKDKNIFNAEYIHQWKIKFKSPKNKTDIAHCATVKDMVTPKITAISNRDESNVQVTIWQTNTTDMKYLVMSDVSSVVEIILQITRVVQPLQSKQYTPPTQPNITCTLN